MGRDPAEVAPGVKPAGTANRVDEEPNGAAPHHFLERLQARRVEAGQAIENPNAEGKDAVGERVKRPLPGGLREDCGEAIPPVSLDVLKVVDELEEGSPAKQKVGLRGSERSGDEAAIGQDRGASLFEADPQHVDLVRRHDAAQQAQAVHRARWMADRLSNTSG